jgi:hypothetical protein
MNDWKVSGSAPLYALLIVLAVIVAVAGAIFALSLLLG